MLRYRIGRQIDRLKPLLRSQRGVGKPIVVVPYVGYGNEKTLRLRGRVLERRLAEASKPGDSRWRNLANMWLRVRTAEIPGVPVVAEYQGVRCETLTDLEGYFQIDLDTSAGQKTDPPNGEQPSTGMVKLRLRAGDPPRGIAIAEAVGKVVVPGPRARFGIISDIDDTIIRTGAGSKVTLPLRLAFSNARTRAVFPEVPSFYRALRAGRGGSENNPFFYISGSPYNLYDMFVEIFRLRGLPVGHMALKNFGVGAIADSMIDQVFFKTAQIGTLFEAYPHLRFVLIGDTGESDPEIYSEMARRFPGKVPVIFLRDLARRRRRLDWQQMRGELEKVGTELVPLNDIAEAKAAAARAGLV
jgi:phosphatidate phosphatase APP1